MRRTVGALLCGGAMIVLLAACAPPAGTDGKLIDDWAAVPAAVSWSPKVGECHLGAYVDSPEYRAHKPVACGANHVIETVHVGAFDERQTPPAEGSPEMRKAYGECLTTSSEFLGEDWRNGRLWLGVAIPSDDAWSGGARWYRCDVWEVKSKDDSDDVPRTDTLKDALRTNRTVAYGCYTAVVKDKKVQTMTSVECTKPHNAEFGGVFVAPDVPYPKTAKERGDMAFAGCPSVLATYANVPNDGNFLRRTGLIITPYGEDEWNLGNRGVRCHLWLGKNVSRSMKGAGPSVLPLS